MAMIMNRGSCAVALACAICLCMGWANVARSDPPDAAEEALEHVDDPYLPGLPREPGFQRSSGIRSYWNGNVRPRSSGPTEMSPFAPTASRALHGALAASIRGCIRAQLRHSPGSNATSERRRANGNGEVPEAAGRQLLPWRFHPALCRESAAWAWDRHQAALHAANALTEAGN